MTELSAYQDLMTYAVTRRADATALEDGEAIGCALAKHAHELAEAVRDRTSPLTPGDCTCEPYCCSCKDTAAFIEAYGKEGDDA